MLRRTRFSFLGTVLVRVTCLTRGSLVVALALLLGLAGGCQSKPKQAADEWAVLEAQAKAGKASPDDLVRLGEYRLDQGQVLEAFELGLQARKADPKSVGGHHLLGLIYQQTDQLPKARESFRKVLELNPSLVPARLNLARVELSARQPVAALETLLVAVKQAPENAEVWLLVGEAQHMRGSPQRAAGSYRQALQLDPNLAPAHAALGSLQLDLGSYQQAIPPLEKAYELGERSPLTLIHLATALVAGRGNPDDLKRAEALLEESKNPNLPSAQLARGLIEQQKGDLAKARRSYETVLLVMPRHERALYGLAETLRAQGEREKAAATLQRYDRIVKQRQALRTLEDRLNQEGDKPALLRQYAIGLYKAEQYAQSAGHFRTWAAKAPNDPEPKQWLKRLQARGIRVEAQP